MPCVDGFVLPVPRKNVQAYRGMAAKAGRIWRAPRSRQRQGDEEPRLAKMMDSKEMPFDPKRMAYGGFKVLVDL